MSCGSVRSASAEEEPPPSPADSQVLIDRLVDWKNAFHNLRLVSRWNNPGQWIQRKPELAAPGALDGYYHIEEWLYSEDGRSRFETRAYEKGWLVSREISGLDGQHQFVCTFKDDMEIPASIHVAVIPEYFSPRQGWLHPFHGGHNDLIPWSIKSVQRAPIKIVRYEEFNGSRCTVARRPEFPSREFFFDPEHDGLIALETESAHGAIWKVDEFRQLDDRLWFPWRGSTLVASNDTPYEWEVLEAEINLELTDAHFTPPPAGPRTVQSGIKPVNAAVTNVPVPYPALDPGGIDTFWFSVSGVLFVGLLVAMWRNRRGPASSHGKTEDLEEQPALPLSVATFAPWAWPRSIRWLLMGAPALLAIYVLSVGPVLRLDQAARGAGARTINRVYYPLLTVNEEVSSWTPSPLDRYCRFWSPGRWMQLQSEHRRLLLERQMRAVPSTQATLLKLVLVVGFIAYLWKGRTVARRRDSSN